MSRIQSGSFKNVISRPLFVINKLIKLVSFDRNKAWCFRKVERGFEKGGLVFIDAAVLPSANTTEALGAGR